MSPPEDKLLMGDGDDGQVEVTVESQRAPESGQYGIVGPRSGNTGALQHAHVTPIRISVSVVHQQIGVLLQHAFR